MAAFVMCVYKKKNRQIIATPIYGKDLLLFSHQEHQKYSKMVVRFSLQSGIHDFGFDCPGGGGKKDMTDNHYVTQQLKTILLWFLSFFF